MRPQYSSKSPSSWQGLISAGHNSQHATQIRLYLDVVVEGVNGRQPGFRLLGELRALRRQLAHLRPRPRRDVSGVRDLLMLPSRPWGWEAHLPLYHALVLEYLGDGGVDRGDEGIGHLGYRAEHLPAAAGILS
jgi:hypothetical protein